MCSLITKAFNLGSMAKEMCEVGLSPALSSLDAIQYHLAVLYLGSCCLLRNELEREISKRSVHYLHLTELSSSAAVSKPHWGGIIAIVRKLQRTTAATTIQVTGSLLVVGDLCTITDTNFLI